MGLSYERMLKWMMSQSLPDGILVMISSTLEAAQLKGNTDANRCRSTSSQDTNSHRKEGGTHTATIRGL